MLDKVYPKGLQPVEGAVLEQGKCEEEGEAENCYKPTINPYPPCCQAEGRRLEIKE